ncbi:FkbM family methyltransferase [Methylomonas sp. MK1]|uniref:FkbM family methyltransferase n=1 Tax=Methylomonas sp. MK1 TaxID=1131552 RepID=UPI0003657638|nr:FkbM family methyltransferase [Methylomonas sp. MK1]
MIKDKKLDSFIYNLLLKHYHPKAKGISKKIWDTCWHYACTKFKGPVSTNIHGKRTIINFGHSYQLFARRFSHWNNPLVEIAYLCFQANNRPIHIVDIGASIGDTVRLLESNCPNMIEHFICIEGEQEFFNFLEENLPDRTMYTLHNSLLSDKEEEIPTLIKTHLGTASAQGRYTSTAVTLDNVLIDSNASKVDLIKIDVDGYDGKVIKGAQKTLAKFHPIVIFEWDPSHCKKTNNSWREHFLILNELGYNQYIWFTKYGDFSHYMTILDINAIDQMAEVCLSDKHDWNWHYDIIALNNQNKIDTRILAEMSYAKSRKSWY